MTIRLLTLLFFLLHLLWDIANNWLQLCHQRHFFSKSAYTNEMMEPLWKQPSSGFESYFRNAVAQGYFKTQNYPDMSGQKVIMDKCCSRFLEPFDKLNCVFALMWTSTAVWQVHRGALGPNRTQHIQVKYWGRCKLKVKWFCWFMLHVEVWSHFVSCVSWGETICGLFEATGFAVSSCSQSVYMNTSL